MHGLTKLWYNVYLALAVKMGHDPDICVFFIPLFFLDSFSLQPYLLRLVLNSESQLIIQGFSGWLTENLRACAR